MKRALFISVMMLALVAAVFAAGSKEAADKELIINSYMSDEKPKAVFQDIVEAFKKANPDLNVTVNTIAHEQFKTQLPSWLASSSAPDVVTWFAGYRMQAYAERGQLEPIDEIFPGGDILKEFPAAFKVASSYQGKVYFMPQSWYWWAV
jgi:multiple sugar transport system substrate-binding protein